MKNYKEIADSVFSRSEEIFKQKEKRRRNAFRAVSVIVPCFIVMLLALNIWTGSFFEKAQGVPCYSDDNSLIDTNVKEELHESEHSILDRFESDGYFGYTSNITEDDSAESPNASIDETPNCSVNNNNGETVTDSSSSCEEITDSTSSPQNEDSSYIVDEQPPIADITSSSPLDSTVDYSDGRPLHSESVSETSAEDMPPWDEPPFEESKETNPDFEVPKTVKAHSLQQLVELFAQRDNSDADALKYISANGYGDCLFGRADIEMLYNLLHGVKVVVPEGYGYSLHSFEYQIDRRYIELTYYNGDNRLYFRCYFYSKELNSSQGNDGYVNYAIINGQRVGVYKNGMGSYEGGGLCIEFEFSDCYDAVLQDGLAVMSFGEWIAKG